MKEFILAEKLKDEMAGKKVIAAVFHTFNFDPKFFENYLLPLFLPDIPFGDDEIQNTILWKKFQNELPPITVYCDFHAKSLKGNNLNYLVRPIDILKINGVKPCFHPKHSFILLQGNTQKDLDLLVFVGSNNLSEAGWCSNLEGVNFIRLKNGVNYPRKFKDAFRYFLKDVRSQFYDKDEKNSQSIAENTLEDFFSKIKYTPENALEVFDSRKKNFYDLLTNLKNSLNGGLAFKKVEVISPYFSSGIKHFQDLQEITACDDISLSIPFENTEDVGMVKELFEKVKALGIKWKAIKGMNKIKGYRRNHSKIYNLLGENHNIVIVGSVNFTQMAWKGVRNGGNYETAIIYHKKAEEHINLLEDYSDTHLSFCGHTEEESHHDTREDVFKLDFIIDWNNNSLEIINYDESSQRGYIEFESSPSIKIDKSKEVALSEEQIELFANNPLIKVKPSGKKIYFYYYPIHKNIESKPLASHLNLNDTELMQLWMELDEVENRESTLSIIDRFIERITDEAGEIQSDALHETSSTLNLMANHLNGLITLNNKIFKESKNKTQEKRNQKLREYYLFADNVDTLIGYRKLLSKMFNDSKLNNGFYWILLNIIDKFFYKKFIDKDVADESTMKKNNKIRDKIKKEIKPLAQNMLEKKISNNHLKWMAKTLEQSVK